MKLKLQDSYSEPHSGWGAGSGTIDREEYFCPCEKGTVIYEKDNIPVFRSKSLYCTCSDCNEKYHIERGTAEWK